MLFTEFDEDIWLNQKKLLAFFSKKFCMGTDEVGRGCLAGPVVAASLILPGESTFFVADSKKLSVKKREMISKTILNHQPILGIAFVHPPAIDQINILNATKLAMIRSIHRCLANAKRFLSGQDILLCIDGNFSLPEVQEICQHSLIQGDNKIAAISAASVIAKVTRDSYMSKMSRIYPNYGFEQHKGYGTKIHRQKIESYGLTSFHRKTFCQGIQLASH